MDFLQFIKGLFQPEEEAANVLTDIEDELPLAFASWKFGEPVTVAAGEPTPTLHSDEITADDHPHAKTQEAKILIIYQNEKKQALRSPDILRGHIGDSIHYHFPRIKDYELVNITGLSKTFIHPYAVVVLTYTQKIAGNIWLFCRNIDTSLSLAPLKLLDGYLGEPYYLSPPTIANYSPISSEGPTSGHFKEEQQVVTYFYRRSNYEIITKTIFFLTFKEDTIAYYAPEGKKTHVVIPKGSVWQTFKSIKLTNGQWWHFLGGALWVLQTKSNLTRSTSRVTENPYPNPKDTEYDFSAKSKLLAQIDFVPESKLDLYAYPFGPAIKEISNGDIVSIINKEIADGVEWFELDDGTWITGTYLKFL